MAEPIITWSPDLEFTVQDRKPPAGVTFKTQQQECVVKVELGKINDLCENCVHRGISNFQSQARELGCNGYVSNVDENKVTAKALKPTIRKPTQGVDLLEPHTIILKKGKRYVCHNKKAGAEGIYILSESTPSCEHFKSRPKPKEKK